MVAIVEQPRDVPAFGERADFGGGAQVGEKGARLPLVGKQHERPGKVVGKRGAGGGKGLAHGVPCFSVIER